MPKYIYRLQTEEDMNREYDSPETAEEPIPQDCPEETALISIDDFYDLLMEQQEQM